MAGVASAAEPAPDELAAAPVSLLLPATKLGVAEDDPTVVAVTGMLPAAATVLAGTAAAMLAGVVVEVLGV